MAIINNKTKQVLVRKERSGEAPALPVGMSNGPRAGWGGGEEESGVLVLNGTMGSSGDG